MKKILVLLSMLVIALFVISCAPKEGAEEGALTGEAGKDLSGPTCKIIDILEENGAKFKGVTATEACRMTGRTCIGLVTSRSQYIEKDAQGNQKTIFFTDISGNYYCDDTILGETKTQNVASPLGLDIRTINQVFCCK